MVFYNIVLLFFQWLTFVESRDNEVVLLDVFPHESCSCQFVCPVVQIGNRILTIGANKCIPGMYVAILYVLEVLYSIDIGKQMNA